MLAKLRQIAIASILLGLSIGFAGLLGEAVVRHTIKDQIVLFPRFHTDAGYDGFHIRRFVPNLNFRHTSVDGTWQFRTNAQGFRNDRDFVYAKPDGRLRILALGDSHTAGYEVQQEQTYSSVAESLLTTREGIDAEVLNTGISGFGTAEELVYLENEGIRYRPDVVVLGFYANDFEDNIKSGLYSMEGHELRLAKKEHLPGIRIQNQLNGIPPIRWLSQNSYFYSFTFNAVYELAKAALASASAAKVQTEYAIAVGELSDYEYELSNGLLSRLYGFCRANDIFLIVLDIPKPTPDNSIVSSIPAELEQVFEANSDVLVRSSVVLQQLVDRRVLIHVPHGHRHISAESHAAFAAAIVEALPMRLPGDAG